MALIHRHRPSKAIPLPENADAKVLAIALTSWEQMGLYIRPDEIPLKVLSKGNSRSLARLARICGGSVANSIADGGMVGYFVEREENPATLVDLMLGMCRVNRGTEVALVMSKLISVAARGGNVTNGDWQRCHVVWLKARGRAWKMPAVSKEIGKLLEENGKKLVQRDWGEVRASESRNAI